MAKLVRTGTRREKCAPRPPWHTIYSVGHLVSDYFLLTWLSGNRQANLQSLANLQRKVVMRPDGPPCIATRRSSLRSGGKLRDVSKLQYFTQPAARL